jgi:hypothetical protein
MAAAGGAIGTAFAPGIGTAIGTIAGGLLDGPMTGSSSAPSGPTSAATAVYGSGLSAENWFVNFSGTQNASAKVDKPFSATGPTATTAAQNGTILPAPAGLSGVASSLGLDMSGLQSIPLWAWAAIGGLVIWRLKSKK